MVWLQAYDQGILYSFETLHRPWLDPVARAVTTLGDPWTLTGVVAALACLFAVLRAYRLALIMVAVGLTSGALQLAVKHAVARPRPDVAWRQIDLPAEGSFPSGHALAAMGIYLGGALLGARLVGSWRWGACLIALGAAAGLLVGLTRPYLGVHYPIDMLAGWLGGTACAFLGDVLAGLPLAAPAADASVQ